MIGVSVTVMPVAFHPTLSGHCSAQVCLYVAYRKHHIFSRWPFSFGSLSLGVVFSFPGGGGVGKEVVVT